MLNGRKADQAFEIKINYTVNSLKRLKDSLLGHIQKCPLDKIRIFTNKGMEIDDADISYLTSDQILYVSLDGILIILNI